MENYYYSAAQSGFFLSSFKELYEASINGWPEDAVEVTKEEHKRLLDGQMQGQIITADSNGYPVLTDSTPPSQEQLIATAEKQRKNLLTEAAAAMAPLQDAVDIEEATEEEKSHLTAWKKYRVLLNRLNISNAPDISWPLPPKN